MSLSTAPPRNRRTLPMFGKPGPAQAMSMVGTTRVRLEPLYRELKASVRGEVRFDRGALGLYATDSSNFRQVPVGIVVPHTLEDIVTTHRVCHRHGVPITSRGGGTSLSGETVNQAVVIDHSKYLRRIGEVDRERRLVTVQNGVVNQTLNEQIGKSGLLFGPDPSSHGYCTIGGNIGNNSCGIHSIQSALYGPGPRTSDNVHALDVVTYDGERFTVGVGEETELDAIIRQGGRKGAIYRRLREFRDRHAALIRRRFRPASEVPRRVSGYNLDEFLPERGFNVARALVGTEGTCVTVLEATLLLTPALLERATVVVAYDDICRAADDAPQLLEWKPIGLEAIDHSLFGEEHSQRMQGKGLQRLPRPGDNAWLLVQFGADTAAEVDETARAFARWLSEEKGYAEDRIGVYESQQAGGDSEAVWEVREAGLGATAFPPGGGDHWPGWEDSAVPPERMGAYIRDLKELYRGFGLRGAMYGHIGQGCVHSRISFDLRTHAGIQNYRAFLDAAADLVVSYGGSLSGEHGDGQQRAEFLSKQYGPELVDAMREFKRIWDPDGKMNPGKVIDPYRVDENLKLGTHYNPDRPKVKFSYRKDGGDFAHAMLRCVGVGKCRKPEGVDVMCPSYIVTKDEKHTTRGRARLLFEMLQGDVIRDGWHSKEVYEALELCLSCKGCTNDCPVNVDMPTYKAEFLYHHFKGLRQSRGRHMYAFGFIDRFARIGSRVPRLVHFLTQTPGLSRVSKWIAGMDPRRKVPKLAPMTLQAWFAERGGTKNPNGPKVLLWPDTFNNHFHTQVGVACVEELEAAGYRVIMPEGHVCCGRPLYDYGFLDQAERYLRRTLEQLRSEIREGTPVVGMEPSCLAVFRDELRNLLPYDDDAARLAGNCYHWAEFFDAHDIELPKVNGEAVIWGHCHQKATGGMSAEQRLLGQRLGLDTREAKGGCCGLAGSWGFESGHYELSMQCAEVGWLPAARSANPNTVLVADGFSCKTQLEQSNVGRRALHTAEVMKLAREGRLTKAHNSYPEPLPAPRPGSDHGVRVSTAAACIALVLAIAIATATWWALEAHDEQPRASATALPMATTKP